jgi:alkaline phosphatase D
MSRIVFLVLAAAFCFAAPSRAAKETAAKRSAVESGYPQQINRGDLAGNMQLLDCRGPFIILSCGTMWSDYVSNGKDSWGVYDPEGRERILGFIEKHRIPGVLLTSGDRHGARVFRIPRPSGYSFYEFEPASLGGRGDGPAATNPKWDTQLFGMAGKYAFGEFTFDAALSDPQVVFRLVHDAGDVLYELKLKRSQLTPPDQAAVSQ